MCGAIEYSAPCIFTQPSLSVTAIRYRCACRTENGSFRPLLLLLLMWVDDSAASSMHGTNRNKWYCVFWMIVEHQPQNVSTTWSIRLAARYGSHKHRCVWQCVNLPHPLYPFIFSNTTSSGHGKPTDCTLNGVFGPTISSGMFSCWCFNSLSVYLPNPFRKHKPNTLSAHTTWN